MSTPRNKNRVLDLLSFLKKDFELLRNREWIPDDDSIDASLEVLSEIIEYIQEEE